jgi:hypothetical protein
MTTQNSTDRKQHTSMSSSCDKGRAGRTQTAKHRFPPLRGPPFQPVNECGGQRVGSGGTWCRGAGKCIDVFRPPPGSRGRWRRQFDSCAAHRTPRLNGRSQGQQLPAQGVGGEAGWGRGHLFGCSDRFLVLYTLKYLSRGVDHPLDHVLPAIICHVLTGKKAPSIHGTRISQVDGLSFTAVLPTVSALMVRTEVVRCSFQTAIRKASKGEERRGCVCVWGAAVGGRGDLAVSRFA